MQVELADVVATAAIFVSILTWYRSSAFEEKVRLDDDARSEFDAVYLIPINSKIDMLSGAIDDLCRACHDSGSVVSVQTAFRHIHKTQHASAYLSLNTFLDETGSPYGRALTSRLTEYWDNAIFHIENIGHAVSMSEISAEAKSLRRTGDAYLMSNRITVQKWRQTIRGEQKSFFARLFGRKNT